MSNLIIVESENDKFFLEALITKENFQNIEIGNPVCNVDDYEYLDGINKLSLRLNDLKPDKYEKIGIILDADKEGIDKRIEFINEALKGNLCDDVTLACINKFERSEEQDIEVACYIMNVDGCGELEDVMVAIKSKDSTYADCLEAWKKCLEDKGKNISDKDYRKFWISNYFRFDTCTNQEKKQAQRKCSNEAAIKKDIWNFEHECLDDLKAFLKLFSN